jgi:hypothetical protein
MNKLDDQLITPSTGTTPTGPLIPLNDNPFIVITSTFTCVSNATTTSGTTGTRYIVHDCKLLYLAG